MKGYVSVLTGLFVVAAVSVPVMAEDYLATIVSDDNAVVAIKNIDPDGEWGYTVDIDLVNKTEKEAMFAIQNAYINGLVLDPYWATTIEGNAERADSIEWNKNDFEKYGIDEVTEIKLDVIIYEADDYTNVYYEDTFVYYPLGEEAVEYYVREAQDTDQILIDTEDLAMTLVDYGVSEWNEFELNLYLENKSSEEISYSVESAVVNGKDIDPYWAAFVPANAREYSSLSWYGATLEEQGIENVETIRLELVVHDEAWDELVNETIELTVGEGTTPAAETEAEGAVPEETETTEPETESERVATEPVDLGKFVSDIAGALSD